MSVWNYLLDNEISQRSDIEYIRDMMVDQCDLNEVKTRINKGIRRDKRQDQQLSDIESSISEMAIMQKALLRYMMEDENFDTEKFRKIIKDLSTEL